MRPDFYRGTFQRCLAKAIAIVMASGALAGCAPVRETVLGDQLLWEREQLALKKKQEEWEPYVQKANAEARKVREERENVREEKEKEQRLRREGALAAKEDAVNLETPRDLSGYPLEFRDSYWDTWQKVKEAQQR